jgi:hypothetical protein
MKQSLLTGHPRAPGSGHDIFGGINDMMFRIPFVGNWLYLIGLSKLP